jgi:hypothetical protein
MQNNPDRKGGRRPAGSNAAGKRTITDLLRLMLAWCRLPEVWRLRQRSTQCTVTHYLNPTEERARKRKFAFPTPMICDFLKREGAHYCVFELTTRFFEDSSIEPTSIESTRTPRTALSEVTVIQCNCRNDTWASLAGKPRDR